MMRNESPLNHQLPFSAMMGGPRNGMVYHLPSPMSNLGFPHELLHPSQSHAQQMIRNRPGQPHRFTPYRRVDQLHPGGNPFPMGPPPIPPLPPQVTQCAPPRLLPNKPHRINVIPHVTLEEDLPKELVETYLKENKAMVILESGKRTRSEVWLYMGRVKLFNSGLLCKDVVACIACKAVYGYKNKSQGTSTLRHHKCEHVFRVLEMKKLKEAEQAQQQLPGIVTHNQPNMKKGPCQNIPPNANGAPGPFHPGIINGFRM